MKKGLSYVILVIVLIIMAVFLAYIVISKQNISKQEFNIKAGDVLNFAEYDTQITILNVASTLCQDKNKCYDEGEVEVSLRAEYALEKSSYTLKSKTNPIQRIQNSNNYIILNFENNKIEISIKDRNEI